MLFTLALIASVHAAVPNASPRAPQASHEELTDLADSATLRAREGRFDEALTLLRRCERFGRDFAGCQRVLGYVYGKMGVPARAVRAYQRFLRLNHRAAARRDAQQLLREAKL